MKIRSLLILFLISAPMVQGRGQFVQNQQPPLLSVSGSAEVKVPPDEIHLRVGVEIRAKDLEAGKRENDQCIANALAFLKTSGIMPKDVQTDYLSIEPHFDDRVSKTTPDFFIIRKSIEIKLTQMGSFEAVLTGLLINGVNAVHGVEFRTSELRKYRDQARAMAIRAAREKADALAAELGVKRGKTYSINANEWGGMWAGSSSYWGRSYGGGMSQNSVQTMGGNASGDDGAMSFGQVSVSATVNVSFLIE